MMPFGKTFLVVAAHPDDEILGCGGTIARLVAEGWTGYTIILGKGRPSEDDAACDAAIAANKAIGKHPIYISTFPDQRYDTIPFLDIVQKIEVLDFTPPPDIIFTHWSGDLNLDHQITFRAVMTAFRPQTGPKPWILSFYIPSSSEWNEKPFEPNFWVNLTMLHVDRKHAALRCYESEMRPRPHPRSLHAVDNALEYIGNQVGLAFGEAFKLVRGGYI